MVVLENKISTIAPAPCELRLESGRIIRYVAPATANPRKEVSSIDEVVKVPRRKSSLTSAMAMEDWEGVNIISHAIDSIVELDMESDFFQGKSVLEIGFASGLPAVYAWENGAAELTIHHPSKAALELYTIPTLKRNNIPLKKCKLSSGDLSELKKAIGSKKFDVIIGADLLNRSTEEFQLLHDIIDSAMHDDGICLFSTQVYYFHVDGCLTTFLDTVKRHRKLDVLERWSSPRTDVVQRKVIQLTRSLL